MQLDCFLGLLLLQLLLFPFAAGDDNVAAAATEGPGNIVDVVVVDPVVGSGVSGQGEGVENENVLDDGELGSDLTSSSGLMLMLISDEIS